MESASVSLHGCGSFNMKLWLFRLETMLSTWFSSVRADSGYGILIPRGVGQSSCLHWLTGHPLPYPEAESILGVSIAVFYVGFPQPRSRVGMNIFTVLGSSWEAVWYGELEHKTNYMAWIWSWTPVLISFLILGKLFNLSSSLLIHKMGIIAPT